MVSFVCVNNMPDSMVIFSKSRFERCAVMGLFVFQQICEVKNCLDISKLRSLIRAAAAACLDWQGIK